MKVILKRPIIIRLLRQTSQQKQVHGLPSHKSNCLRIKLIHSLCARFTEDEHE